MTTSLSGQGLLLAWAIIVRPVEAYVSSNLVSLESEDRLVSALVRHAAFSSRLLADPA